MSGHLILNVETAFALAFLALLLWRCPGGRISEPASKWKLDARDILPMAAVVLATVGVFWRAAHIYFLSDDFVLLEIAKNFQFNYGYMLTHAGGAGFFRPLGYVSLAWISEWVGMDPVRWHWAGLAYHIANSLLVYVLAGAIGLSRLSAWFASALFAWRGSSPEAAVWIAGHFDQQAAFFTLLGLVAFSYFWVRPSIVWGAVTAIAMIIGSWTKESAYALAPMMLVFALSRPAGVSSRGGFRKKLRLLTPFLLLAVCLFAYRWALQGGIGGYLTADGKPQMAGLNLVGIANALALRLWAILFFPIDWAAGAGVLRIGVGLAAVTIVYVAAWFALAWKPRGPRRKLLVPLGFALAAALPPVQQLLIGADLEKARVVYLASAGFCLFIAAAVEMTGPSLRAGAAVVMLVFSLATLQHNLGIWKNGIWEDAGAKSETVCEAVAKCSNPEAVTGLPRILRGVYFFANGLPECVRLQRAENPDLPRHACTLAWDAETEELR